MQPAVSEDLLGFVYLAGTERSTAKVFSELMRFVGERVGAHRTTVYRVDGDQARFLASEAIGQDSTRTGDDAERHSWEAAFLTALMSSGASARATEIPYAPLQSPSVAQPSRTAWSVPLAIDGALLGYLVCEGSPGALESCTDQIQQMGGFIALALANARLLAHDEERAEEGDALLDVASVLSESTELGTVLASVARNSARATGFQRCSILLENDDGELEPVMSQFADGHTEPKLWQQFRDTSLDLPAAHEAIATGTPAAFDSPHDHPDLIPAEWLGAYNIGSVLLVPLMVWGRTFGVLLLDHIERLPITSRQIRIAQAVASQGAAAIGISNLLVRESASRQEAERAAHAIQEGERRLQAILDDASDAIISTLDDTIIVFNRRACAVFGYTPDQVLGKPFHILFPEHLLDIFAGALRDFAASDATRTIMGDGAELTAQRFDGTEFPVEVAVSKVRVDGRRVLTTIVRDLSERIEAQEQIDETERRFRNLFERSPIAMWEEDFTVVDTWMEGLRAKGVVDLREYLEDHPDVLENAIELIQVRNVNEAAVALIEADNVDQLLGGFRAEIRTEGVREVFIDQLETVWDGRDSAAFDFTATTYKGKRIDCVLHIAAGRSGDNLDLSHVIVALADITERKAAEVQLRQIAKSKDDLIASVSHEIRTPLTAVLGFAQLLRDDHERLSEGDRVEMLDSLLTQSTDVANIVEDLLVAAKADLGKLHVANAPVDLRTEVTDVLGAWEPTVVAGVTIHGPSVSCSADPSRVRQIIRNLTSNALRYGGDLVRVDVGATDRFGYITVTDNGPGVPINDIERIFEKYERGDQYPGLTGALGIGLGLSRHLARLMDGDVTYRRVDNESIFELALPLS